jgi:hypothetical protein
MPVETIVGRRAVQPLSVAATGHVHGTVADGDGEQQAARGTTERPVTLEGIPPTP